MKKIYVFLLNFLKFEKFLLYLSSADSRTLTNFESLAIFVISLIRSLSAISKLIPPNTIF